MVYNYLVTGDSPHVAMIDGQEWRNQAKEKDQIEEDSICKTDLPWEQKVQSHKGDR